MYDPADDERMHTDADHGSARAHELQARSWVRRLEQPGGCPHSRSAAERPPGASGDEDSRSARRPSWSGPSASWSAVTTGIGACPVGTAPASSDGRLGSRQRPPR